MPRQVSRVAKAGDAKAETYGDRKIKRVASRHLAFNHPMTQGLNNVVNLNQNIKSAKSNCQKKCFFMSLIILYAF